MLLSKKIQLKPKIGYVYFGMLLKSRLAFNYKGHCGLYKISGQIIDVTCQILSRRRVQNVDSAMNRMKLPCISLPNTVPRWVYETPCWEAT